MEEVGINVIQIVGATVSLLLVATGVMAVSKRIRIPFTAARIAIPFTVGLVVTGMALAQLARFGGEAFAPLANLRNLSTTMGHSTGLIREQCPVW